MYAACTIMTIHMLGMLKTNDIKQYGAMESYWRYGVMGKSWVFSAASSFKTARSSATNSERRRYRKVVSIQQYEQHQRERPNAVILEK